MFCQPQRWWGVSVWWSGGAAEVLWVARCRLGVAAEVLWVARCRLGLAAEVSWVSRRRPGLAAHRCCGFQTLPLGAAQAQPASGGAATFSGCTATPRPGPGGASRRSARYPRRRLDEGPDDEHDGVVQRMERPRVCNVLSGLHVHERQDDRERQVHEEVLPLVRVHVRKKRR